jgi:hypothetical protein
MTLFRIHNLRSVLFVIALAFVLLSTTTISAQALRPNPVPAELSPIIRASSAYAEILVKQTEIESELESLLLDYTDEFPRVRELKQSLSTLRRDTDKISATKLADAGRLTQALGKLIVRRVDLETDLWELLQTYKEEHPDVKRAKRRVEVYDKAIKQILN